MRSVALVGILLSTTILGGCAGTIGGITLSSISSFAGLASTLFTGADLGEHAASLITGKDCRFSEGLLREDRDVCEEPGSLATRDDFHGIFVERIDPDGTVIYAAPKYMPASVGAGEYENKAEAIWAQIKTQKLAEENERQLARAQSAQTIDVAALATGSVSSQSLAFLPAGTQAEAELADGETASQTSSNPRTISNAAPQAAKRVASAESAPAAEVKAPEAVEMALDFSQPAIDEKSFAASVRPREAGEGGPFIATAASSTPVASTLINGEPVVVLRLRPIFSASGSATAPVSSATPIETTETASAEPATFVTPLSAQPSTVPSPLAILERTPTRSDAPIAGVAPQTVAAAEPELTEARPRVKPAAQEIAAVEAKPAKPVRAAPVRPRQVEKEDADVYQPPARAYLPSAPRVLEPAPSTLAADTTSYTPVQTPVDVPSEPAPALTPMVSEPTPAATGGPAPLAPMPQE